jgi:hypothetical protein
MLSAPVFLPLLHGEAGILDELLLFGAPLIVAIIILAMASRRARKNTPRQRAARESSHKPPQPPQG